MKHLKTYNMVNHNFAPVFLLAGWGVPKFKREGGIYPIAVFAFHFSVCEIYLLLHKTDNVLVKF